MIGIMMEQGNRWGMDRSVIGIKMRDGPLGDVDRNRSGLMGFTTGKAKTGSLRVKIESDY